MIDLRIVKHATPDQPGWPDSKWVIYKSHIPTMIQGLNAKHFSTDKP